MKRAVLPQLCCIVSLLYTCISRPIAEELNLTAYIVNSPETNH